MIVIHKFSKISMVVGLLFASASWVHAMDVDEDIAVVLAASAQLAEDQAAEEAQLMRVLVESAKEQEEAQLMRVLAASIAPVSQQILPSSPDFFKGWSYGQIKTFLEVWEQKREARVEVQNNPFIYYQGPGVQTNPHELDAKNNPFVGPEKTDAGDPELLEAILLSLTVKPEPYIQVHEAPASSMRFRVDAPGAEDLSPECIPHVLIDGTDPVVRARRLAEAIRALADPTEKK